jgi:predicted nucleic acid-binding protein
VTGLTLDAGALMALERGDRSTRAIIARADEHGDRITIPATALAQVIRTPIRQVRLMRLCRQPNTDVVPLDRADATAVGALLAESRTADIVDAHVVICARRAQQVVVTSDRTDIARLAPDLTTIAI